MLQAKIIGQGVGKIAIRVFNGVQQRKGFLQGVHYRVVKGNYTIPSAAKVCRVLPGS